jgi:hypothetical protein
VALPGGTLFMTLLLSFPYDTLQIGSAALLSMYLVVKYLGKEWINKLLGWYFAVTGVASVWKVCQAIDGAPVHLSDIHED